MQENPLNKKAEEVIKQMESEGFPFEDAPAQIGFRPLTSSEPNMNQEERRTWLKNKRAELGLTQEQCIELGGYGVYIKEFESGERGISDTVFGYLRGLMDTV